MIRVGLAFFVTAIAHGFAFRESLQGTTAFWLWIAVPALLLAALAVHHFWDTGTLGERLLPRWGDLSIGALTALVLLVASWVARGTLSPSGTVRQSWLYRVYLQIGDPEALRAVERSVPRTAPGRRRRARRQRGHAEGGGHPVPT